MEHLFLGSALGAVDGRGRVALPEFVQRNVGRAGGGSLVMTVHESGACIESYDPAHARSVHADQVRRRETERLTPEAYAAEARRAFGSAEQLQVPASGKVALPPRLRAKAGIGGQVLFVGTGATFEIWSPETARDSGDIALRDLADWHLN